MILTSLSRAADYEFLSPRFKLAFDYLRNTDLKSLPLGGKIFVDGEDVFAMPQLITTKPDTQCKWEAHRKYADIQYIVTGTERMAVGPLELFDVIAPHDDARDVAFFSAKSLAIPFLTTVTVPSGFFTVFLPKDVHMPLIQTSTPDQVLKVVMKVRV